MKSPRVFNCQQCDAEMEAATLADQAPVTCRRCGRLYRLRFSEERQAWLLQAEEPVEEAAEKRRGEEPFSVMAEVGRPKRVDRAERYREQTDLHQDEEQAVDKPHREP